MPFQPAPNCAEVTLNAVLFSQDLVNTLHFHKSAGYDQDDIDALAEAVDSVVAEDYKTIFSNQITYTGTIAKGLETNTDLQAINLDSVGACSGVAAAAPANVSQCITLRTAFTGRSARGRFYSWPPTLNDLVNSVTINNDWGALVREFLLTVMAATGPIGWDMVVLSRQHNGVVRAEAVPYVITAVQKRNNNISSQRGRLAQG